MIFTTSPPVFGACWASRQEFILKIDTFTGSVSLLEHLRLVGRSKYQGGMLAVDGAIYAMPDRAPRVLRIFDGVPELLGTPLEGHFKWQGAVAAKDGTIFGLPNRAKSVLEIRFGAEKRPFSQPLA